MKIKIRIAVAANPSGEWAAYGYSNGRDSWDQITDAFDLLENDQRFWVEAELNISDDHPAVAGTSVKAT